MILTYVPPDSGPECGKALTGVAMGSAFPELIFSDSPPLVRLLLNLSWARTVTGKVEEASLGEAMLDIQ